MTYCGICISYIVYILKIVIISIQIGALYVSIHCVGVQTFERLVLKIKEYPKVEI